MKGAVVRVKLPQSLLQDDQIVGYCCVKNIFVINDQKIFLVELLNLHHCDHIRAIQISYSGQEAMCLYSMLYIHIAYCM